MKSLKKENKGFSLVELIVVIAILGILAVTLAPRLMHYVEKARVASDQEVVNTILTAAKFGYMQYGDDWEALADDDGKVELGAAAASPSTAIFEISGKEWTKAAAYAETNKFANEIRSVVDNFTLKGSEAGSKTQIYIIVDDGNVSVELHYDDTDTDLTPDYVVPAE